jgi:hypothetical protein
MPETAELAPEATSPDSPLEHFIWGAVPAAAAVLGVLWQLLDPYVPLTHQGLLFGIAVFLGNVSLAIWMGCKISAAERKTVAAERRSEERDRLATARAERLQQEMYVLGDTVTGRQDEILDLLGKIQRSLQSAHRHMDKQDAVVEEQKAEMAHLRKLILGVDATEPPQVNGQQLGPRRLNLRPAAPGVVGTSPGPLPIGPRRRRRCG